MRVWFLLLAVIAVSVFPEPAPSQVVLPWETQEEPQAPASEEVAESDLPLVKARLEGSAEVWVGQAVGLTVEVIVPTWFTSAPAFPQIEVEKAVALSPEGTVNFVVRSGGKNFAAQSLRYVICPQAQGGYTVPPVKVGVSYALQDGSPSPQELLASPPVRFEARKPPGAEKARYFLTTEDFQISQSLSARADELEVGDSVTRTITMSAENTVGMSLPPLEFEAPRGVRIYSGMPRITEAAERGAIEASRTETATYVPEQEGHYRLPGITILWWNPRTEKMNEATLSAIDLKVRAGSGGHPEVFASSQADEAQGGAARAGRPEHLRRVLHWAVPLLAAFLVSLVLRRVFGQKVLALVPRIAEMRRRRAKSEASYFKQFHKASLSGDPRAVLRHLMRWLDRTAGGLSAPTLRQFAAQSGVPELARAAEELNDLLFARQMNDRQLQAMSKGLEARLYKLVAKARKLQKSRGKQRHREPPLLKGMN